MILPAESAGLLNRENVHSAFDDAKQGSIAMRIGADSARVDLSETSAIAAMPNLLPRFAYGVGEPICKGGIALDKVERDAFGRTRTDTWQFVQNRNQLEKWFGE